MRTNPAFHLAISMLVFAIVSTGCTTVRESLPPRTATEQMLLNYSTINSLRQIDMSVLNGRKASLGTKSLKVTE